MVVAVRIALFTFITATSSGVYASEWNTGSSYCSEKCSPSIHDVDLKDQQRECDSGNGAACSALSSRASEQEVCVQHCQSDVALQARVCEASGGTFSVTGALGGFLQCEKPATCPANSSLIEEPDPTILGDCLCADGITGVFEGETCPRTSVVTKAECETFKNPFDGTKTPEWDENNCDAVVAAEENTRLANEWKEARVAALNSQVNTELDTAESEARTACNSSSPSSFFSSCDSIKASVDNNNSGEKGTTLEQCKQLQTNNKSVLQQSASQINSCTSKASQIRKACRTEVSVAPQEESNTFGDVNAVAKSTVETNRKISENNSIVSRIPAIQSNLSDQSAKLSSSLKKVDEAAEKCIAALEEDPKDPTANSHLNQAQDYSSKASSYGGGSGGYGRGGEFGAGGFAAGKALGELAKNAYDKFGGRSNGLDLSNGNDGLGDPYGGADDSVYTGGNPATKPYQAGSNPNPLNGAGKATSAILIGGSGNSSPNAAKNKRRRYKSAKARNLVNGFKSLKASDGGGALSVKNSDFKRYGKKALKAKLAEARKRHGKDLPLIFKNGKFVLDFLAMKESKKFKAKVSAMENYMKGKGRRSASISDLPIHQNPNLNIFKIMNFRYQRQEFNDKK